MPYLDLDFKEKKCNFSIFFLLLLLTSSLFLLGYVFYLGEKRIKTIKTEANLLYNTQIVPVGFLKDSAGSAMLIKTGKRTILVRYGDSLQEKGTMLRVFFTDSQVILKGKNFERNIEW